MKSKERVLAAIEHAEPDRVPIDFSAEPEVLEKLYSHFGHCDYNRLLEELNVDLRYIHPREVVYEKDYYVGPEVKVLADGTWYDIWGVGRSPVAYKAGVYQQMVFSPLEGVVSVNKAEEHPWPDPDWYDCSRVPEQCARYQEYALVGGGWGAVFGDTSRILGMEHFMASLIEAPEVVKAVIRQVEEFYLEVDVRLFEAARGMLDIYYFGNDFGTQQNLLMSETMIRDFFGPSLRNLIGQAKGYGLKVMFHSCGSVRAIIPFLIELGVDILDPIQVGAEGMSPLGLKADFGERIAFHGGVDTQGVLPFGSSEEVRRAVKDLLEIMKPGGGFILAPSQELQPDVPMENILAMYEAAIQYGRYG